MECNSITQAIFMPVQHGRTSELLAPLSSVKKHKLFKEKFNIEPEITLLTSSRTIMEAVLPNLWQ